MCGLVGIAGQLDYYDEALFKRLLVLDVFRGLDSTGAAFVGKEGVDTVKMATNPLNLFQVKKFEKLLNGYSSTAFIGHNRAATLGKVNDANAHPFTFGNITGAHNGTLDRASWSRLEAAAGFETDVDSAAIFAAINEVGIEQTISLMEKGRTSSTGAWALTWYDESEGTMNFIRNEHRPLWYGFNKDKDKFIWASEWPMIDGAVNLTKGADELFVDKEGYSFWPFEEDMLYSIDLDRLMSKLTIKEFLEECKVKKLEGRKPAPLASSRPSPQQKSGGKGPWVQENQETQQNTTTSSKNSNTSCDGDTDDVPFKDDKIPTFGTPPSKVSSNVIDVDFQTDKPFAGYVTEEEFNDIAKYGCSFCQADVQITDPNITVYKEDRVVLCADCSRERDGNQRIYV